MSDRFQKHGAFSWCELITQDPGAAKKFYGALLGWQFEEMGMQGMPYAVVKAAGEDAGGIMATPPDAPGMPPTWGVYVTVDDVDRSAEHAKALGGQVIVAPRDIPDVGRFCVIQDPQGAMISLITYRMGAA
jgi:predicted enzyme related to lactoylglutathione lyase